MRWRWECYTMTTFFPSMKHWQRFFNPSLEDTDFIEAVVRRCSSKKMFLKILKIQNKVSVLKSLFNKVAGLQAWNFIKKTLTQEFSCEVCKIFENIVFYRTPPVAAPGFGSNIYKFLNVQWGKPSVREFTAISSNSYT